LPGGPIDEKADDGWPLASTSGVLAAVLACRECTDGTVLPAPGEVARYCGWCCAEELTRVDESDDERVCDACCCCAMYDGASGLPCCW
jgi:hypothetical protein